MPHAGGRKPAIKQWAEATPTNIGPLTAMTKSPSPQLAEPMPKGVHRPKISRHSVVLIETLRNPPQPRPGLRQWLVHPLAQLQLNLLQLCHHPLVRRLPPDHEPTPRTGATLVDKSKKRERFRLLLASLASVHGRESAELQQPRLLPDEAGSIVAERRATTLLYGRTRWLSTYSARGGRWREIIGLQTENQRGRRVGNRLHAREHDFVSRFHCRQWQHAALQQSRAIALCEEHLGARARAGLAR